MSSKSDMDAPGKSDGGEVPKKRPNEGAQAPEEAVEGRPTTEGNPVKTAADRTQGRDDASSGLARVREAAVRDKEVQFTALMHHVTEDLLAKSFHALKRGASPGVDGVTWGQYEDGLEARLRDLHERVHRGTYRAQPSKRAYIPKPDGQSRPLGIAALEDKIVQRAIGWVLEAIYEADFKGFSYGFRPGRGPHDALDALWVGLMTRKVNWVLDADIQGFFDTLDHGWLMKFLEHRVADPRVLRSVAKWLRAGVSEEGTWRPTRVGTPQGAVISPLLANVYLHYVLDLWVEAWRETSAKGDVIVVRYADDFVMGFQDRAEAERFLAELRERLQKFGLVLHPDKTRLIEFGRFADERRRERGEGKPETFGFLGFTHICAKTRKTNAFTVMRRTVAKRLKAKLQDVKQRLSKLRHLSLADVGAWLGQVVRGYFNYHAVPGNYEALASFRDEVAKLWLWSTRRRSQRHRMPWERFSSLVARWIPRARILHPYPDRRFFAIYPR